MHNTLLTATAEVPVLVSVAVWVALTVPSDWGLKLRLAGERVNVPEIVSMFVLLGPS